MENNAFKRGYKEQKWYYTSVYESLITNEDENHPMFVRLKELVDHIFNDKKNDEYVKNVIFEDNIDEYNKSLLNMKDLASNENINFNLFDTTDKNQRVVSFEVSDVILKDMRNKCIEKLHNEYN